MRSVGDRPRAAAPFVSADSGSTEHGEMLHPRCGPTNADHGPPRWDLRPVPRSRQGTSSGPAASGRSDEFWSAPAARFVCVVEIAGSCEGVAGGAYVAGSPWTEKG